MAFHNDEFAVKVTEVEAGVPPRAPGYAPGLDSGRQRPVGSAPDDLTDAVRQAGQNFRLTVVDPASGRKDTVNIACNQNRLSRKWARSSLYP